MRDVTTRSASEHGSAGVSASIVLYNSRLSEVAGLIDELLQQGVACVFIVDNSDRDFDCLSGMALPRHCEYLRSERNVGYGAGHNLAIQRAVPRYRYHIICNPDVRLGTETVRTLQDYLESHPAVGMAMPKLLNVDGSVQYCCRRSPVLWDYLSQLIVPPVGAKRRWRLEMRDHDYDQEMDVPCLSGCFLFVRTTTLQQIGGFDPLFFLYFEDFDLSRRVRQVTATRYVPQTSIVHERQSAHRRSWKLKWLFLRSALRYFNRWGYFG